MQIEHGVRPHSKYLTEYFNFLNEFAKLGEEECSFLTSINCISSMVAFYMGQKQQENYVSSPANLCPALWRVPAANHFSAASHRNVRIGIPCQK